MAKYGDDGTQYGEVQYAEPAEPEIDSEIQQEVRERAIEVMKSVFPVEEGTNWDAILSIVLTEFKHEYEVMDDIINGRFIDYADHRQLDLIGEMWDTYRKTGEDDGHYRARIKANFSRHTSRATVQEMFDVATTILRTEHSHVHGEENFHIEPARFDLWIDDIVFHDSGVTVDEFETLMQDVKPAGVKLWATIGEQFTHRSQTDFNEGINDEDRAYDGYDDTTITEQTFEQGGTHDDPIDLTIESDPQRLDVGGGYADRVTRQLDPFTDDD